MSLSSGRNRLITSWKELRIAWEHATEQWDDPASRRWEKEYLDSMEGAVRGAVSAMEKMVEISHQVRRDCQ